MTKLELARHHVAEFSLHVDFPSESSKFESAFGDLLAETGQRSLVRFFDTYRRRKEQTVIDLLLGRIRDHQYHFHLTGETEESIDKPEPKPKAIQDLQRGYELLSLIDGVHVLQAELSLVYEASRFFTNVHLPINLSSAGQSESIFDEIRGMRLEKYSADAKPKYTSIIDYPTLEMLHNIVRFSYAGKLTEESVQKAFDSGIQISKLFVRPQPNTRREQP
jgi:hypothetical protein